MKTVSEIRRSSARDTCIAESVDLVLNTWWDWKPVERLKQRSDVVSFTHTHTHTPSSMYAGRDTYFHLLHQVDAVAGCEAAEPNLGFAAESVRLVADHCRDTHNSTLLISSTQLGSVQFKMVSKCSGKPMRTPPRLSNVSPMLVLKKVPISIGLKMALSHPFEAD